VGTDVELLALFAALHLIGMGLAAALLVMFMRSSSAHPWSPPEEDGGDGGGSDRTGPRRPSTPGGGGIPLADAVPARVRLRQRQRLADLLPGAARRPAHAPEHAPAISTRPRGRSAG
jgi:hypothetical protein